MAGRMKQQTTLMTETLRTLTTGIRFPLELGGDLPGITIGYHTHGTLNEAKDNVIWICHALTANSDPTEWWPGLVGPGKLFDPGIHYIVCANMLGSCYGTSGPVSINPLSGHPWYLDFPKITIRDMVAAHELLRKHLGISSIHTMIGGSIGAHQAMEWAILAPDLVKNLILLATNALISPWAIAFNHSQRMAIEADPTFKAGCPAGGYDGLKAARSIALLSYRNRQTYNRTQQEHDMEKTDCFKASSYQEYQGEKLIKRYNAYSYHLITCAMDTHNVARGRKSIADALGQIRSKTLAVGISSDILFPPDDLKVITDHVQGCQYAEISSGYGHDGFLIEDAQLTAIIRRFYKS